MNGNEESDVIISVRNLGLKIKKDVILQSVNMNLERGTIYGIVGRNGSGKTMLMKCICGFVRPTTGEIQVDGKKLARKWIFHRMWA